MSNAALTPQIRTFLFCDEVVRSEIEEEVYYLEGVREQFVVDSFPHWHSLEIFLGLAYRSGGTFRGKVCLKRDETEEIIQEVEFIVTFDIEDEGVFFPVELGPCIFPEPGRYTGELWFTGAKGQAVQKAQRSILLVPREG